MSLIERLFSGRRWQYQLGAALLLLALVAVFTLLPRSTSLAQTNGFVLKFDFGQVDEPNSPVDEHSAVQSRLAELETAVHDWAKARQTGEEDTEARCEVMISVNVDNGHLTATLALAGEGREVLEDLAATLAQVPGIPGPTITEATWFHDGKLDPTAGLSFNIMDHMFTFPKDASEEEIELTINDWLQQNRPELQRSVDVTITRSGDSADGAEREKVEIRIKLVDQSEEKH